MYLSEILSARIISIIHLRINDDLTYVEEIEKLIHDFEKPIRNVFQSQYVNRLHNAMNAALAKNIYEYISKTNLKYQGEPYTEMTVRSIIGSCYEITLMWVEGVPRMSNQMYAELLINYFENNTRYVGAKKAAMANH